MTVKVRPSIRQRYEKGTAATTVIVVIRCESACAHGKMRTRRPESTLTCAFHNRRTSIRVYQA